LVLRAIENGDPDAALKHMLDHIGVGGRDFTEYLSSTSADFFESPGYGNASGNQRNSQSDSARQATR
jgi:hypothetical protein